MRRARSTVLMTLLLGGAASAGAAIGPGDPPKAAPTIAAEPVTVASAVRLDGLLNDAVWDRARKITGFVQREPRDGAPASHPTEVGVAYDDEAIYVAVWAFDPEPEKIVGYLTRRDRDSPSDWISVDIDSFHDHRSAFEFRVNPAGVKTDLYRFNDTSEDDSWDAVWDVAVARDDRGWRAEFRIPFSQLRYDRRRGDTFGLAVGRQIARLNEKSSWPHLPKSASGVVSSFGDLTNLSFERSPKKLEVVPYAVAEVRTQPASGANPLLQATDPGSSLGADLKYAVAPGLTLTGSVNPDFGQVEADPAVVNLSAFETFFEERRPFFVEGSGNFQFDIICNDGQCTGLFYSRRIGRPPQGEPGTPEGGWSASPAQSTILGAAKLAGRVGSYSVGVLNALTSSEHASIADGTSQSRRQVEPFTSYTVARARREFVNRSSVGFMMTATNRKLSDATRFLADQAYTGGLDWDWRLRASHYSLSGYWAGSTVRGSEVAIARLQQSNVHSFQRPDAEHVDYDPTRTVLNGHTGLVSFGRIAGERLRFNTNAGFRSPGFEINDVGYLRRADEAHFSNWLQLRRDQPTTHLRSYRVNFNQWNGWNFDGDRLSLGGNVNAHAVFTSNWRVGGGFSLNAAGFDDRATRGGPGVLDNREINYFVYVGSDDRRALSFEVEHYLAADWFGSTAWQVSPSLVCRPTTALELTGGIAVNRNVDDAQWVGNVTGASEHYVFAHLDQTTLSFTARVNYTITPTLSVQVYAQPFVSAGAYTSFKELVDGRAPRYEDRYAPFPYDGAPDFNYRSFRATNVLRWEYRPGSTLFVVWQQGREEDATAGGFRFARDFRRVFSAPGSNVFLVKLSYWLNF